jgi:hypothetical protein
MTPIRAGEEPALASHLRTLGAGDKSPLAALPYVHFGRWMIIDQLKADWSGAPSPPPRLKSQYLLFSASLTAPADGTYAAELPGSFFRELVARIPAEADAIWRHCVGYPGSSDSDAFVRYLDRSRLETSLFYVGYPDVTVGEVRAAVTARHSLIAFALNHQAEQDPVALQRAYIEESRTWFPST